MLKVSTTTIRYYYDVRLLKFYYINEDKVYNRCYRKEQLYIAKNATNLKKLSLILGEIIIYNDIIEKKSKKIKE